MKKLTSILLSLILVLAMSVPAFAAEYPTSDFSDTSLCDISLNGLENYRVLDFEEVIAQDMEHYNISYEAARSRLLAEEAEMLAEYYGAKHALSTLSSQNTHSDQIEYREYSKEFSYKNNGSFKGLLEARIGVINDYGVHKAISRVQWMMTRASAGLHSYSWVDGGSDYEIQPDKKSVDFFVVGYFEMTVDVSLNIGGDASGFTVGGSIGTQLIYRSDTVREYPTYYVT